MLTNLNIKIKIFFVVIIFLLTTHFEKSIAYAEIIDTLDFLSSDHAFGKSDPQALNYMSEFMMGNSSFQNKSNMSQYEYHVWDDQYIYLRQDTGLGAGNVAGNLQTARSYTMFPGIWMKRKMNVGETLMNISTLTFYDKDCKQVDVWPYFYHNMTLEAHTKFNAGGDLGWQDVIILRYDYLSGYERFFYSKEWGYIRWEEWAGEPRVLKRVVDFNRKATGFSKLIAACGTKQPATPTPTPMGKRSDANGDGAVDGLDYVMWLNNYGRSLTGKKYGDFDNNSRVDGLDYVMWLNDLNK